MVREFVRSRYGAPHVRCGQLRTDVRPITRQARTLRDPERTVYSLADNRLSAHVQRGGGLVVLAGSAGFAKYLRFRRANIPFLLRQERDGKKVARFKKVNNRGGK